HAWHSGSARCKSPVSIPLPSARTGSFLMLPPTTSPVSFTTVAIFAAFMARRRLMIRAHPPCAGGKGYRGREATLHTLAEMMAWMDYYVKTAGPRQQPQRRATTGELVLSAECVWISGAPGVRPSRKMEGEDVAAVFSLPFFNLSNTPKAGLRARPSPLGQ